MTSEIKRVTYSSTTSKMFPLLTFPILRNNMFCTYDLSFQKPYKFLEPLEPTLTLGRFGLFILYPYVPKR